MITVSVTDNLKDTLRGLDDLALKQAPFATAVALTRTAKGGSVSLQAELPRVFDNPTPGIARGTFSTSATKAKPAAEFGMRDKENARGFSPAKYTAEHFSSGARDLKRFERALVAIGAMPDGYKAMPGEDMEIDRYGNPDKKKIIEMLATLRAGSKLGAFTGRGKKQKLVAYFVVQPGASDPRVGGMLPGVYRRISSGTSQSVARAVFIFVRNTAYDRRIDLPSLARDVINREFGQHFSTALAQAVSTSR